tara:strand:- start:250 stop:714 length:465 start_codon:yes stop_codon:yes gene_type:complete
MNETTIIYHSPGAIGLRILGLGPNFLPCDGLGQLKNLLEENTTWAKNRSLNQLKKTLKYSNVIVSLWKNRKIIGFGRASSDYVFRATLWDIVIKEEEQRNGNGKMIVRALLNNKAIKNVEKIYLMTSESENFYYQLGFKRNANQTLMVINKSSN